MTEDKTISSESPNKLKPCPFCGGRAELFEIKDADGWHLWEAGCETCGVHFRRYRESSEEARKLAAEKWNTRKE